MPGGWRDAAFPPVLLHLRAEAGHGEAKAVFAEEPSVQHYELLKAVGVEYLGGDREGPYSVARFRNYLPAHLHSGELAGFARTSHCNLFFFRHGSIGRQLERGLISASTGKVSWAAEQARKAIVRLANEAGNGEDLALSGQPPAGNQQERLAVAAPTVAGRARRVQGRAAHGGIGWPVAGAMPV